MSNELAIAIYSRKKSTQKGFVVIVGHLFMIKVTRTGRMSFHSTIMQPTVTVRYKHEDGNEERMTLLAGGHQKELQMLVHYFFLAECNNRIIIPLF